MKRNLIISCCYTLAYFVIANLLFYNNILYYFSGAIDGLGTILMFPAILTFGAGYAGGDGPAIIMTLIFFLVIWILFFIFVLIARKTYAAFRKNKS